MKLSGGERQRISIARALLHGGSVTLVDEGTSALDDKTEATILRTMRPKSPSHVVLMVAHRASAIAAADAVVNITHPASLTVGPEAAVGT